MYAYPHGAARGMAPRLLESRHHVLIGTGADARWVSAARLRDEISVGGPLGDLPGAKAINYDALCDMLRLPSERRN